MKVLIDEQLDLRMKKELFKFNVSTVHDLGWLGLKNGALRDKLNEENFDYFITADKNLPFQQNLNKANFCILLLNIHDLVWEDEKMFIPKLSEILDNPPNPLPKVICLSIVGLSSTKKLRLLEKLLGDDIIFISDTPSV
jgi:hypothetical protein